MFYLNCTRLTDSFLNLQDDFDSTEEGSLHARQCLWGSILSSLNLGFCDDQSTDFMFNVNFIQIGQRTASGDGVLVVLLLEAFDVLNVVHEVLHLLQHWQRLCRDNVAQVLFYLHCYLDLVEGVESVVGQHAVDVES